MNSFRHSTTRSEPAITTTRTWKRDRGMRTAARGLCGHGRPTKTGLKCDTRGGYKELHREWPETELLAPQRLASATRLGRQRCCQEPGLLGSFTPVSATTGKKTRIHVVPRPASCLLTVERLTMSMKRSRAQLVRSSCSSAAQPQAHRLRMFSRVKSRLLARRRSKNQLDEVPLGAAWHTEGA